MADPVNIDRLIEEGLNRYGTGDLDGALLSWEEALAIDPENPQANSYVDYVRMNYELLVTDSGPEVAGDDGSFGIGTDNEPEYQIEISPGEMPQATGAPMYMDPLDAGWFIDDETHDVALPRAKSVSVQPRTVEIEAEEPPPAEGINFDDQTREYPNGKRPPTNDFTEEATGGFKAEATPLGFAHQETGVKKRDLGFVQPAREATAPMAQSPVASNARTRTPTGELKVRLRTPTAPQGTSIDLSAPSAPARDTDLERTERGMPPVVKTPAAPSASELISSLPSPRPASSPGRITPPRGSKVQVDQVIRIPSRDTPTHKDDDIAMSQTATLDLERLPTQPPTQALGLSLDDPLMTAQPTRELGLRPGGRPHSQYPDEEIPTLQADARGIREHHEAQSAAEAPIPSEGTRHDIVLPFDPIDARSAQILDDVDAEGNDGESKDDKVRRRITSLLERAVTWNTANELDKAVAAVDLVLSEDPNSALAQKLIHRNRDTIMMVFQNFLGDLERMPQLARPLHELASAPISPRAAFLLSRIDGTLSLDEILDVSGMPRLEAYRHLCQLFLRGILR